MMKINPKSIYSVAKKEFTDNLRNRWIIALTIILVILTIAASVLGGGGTIGGMDETVTTLLSISSILIPLIAIMLGCATISGEAESGALSLVLSYPVRRVEVLLGKFFGLGMVIVVSSVIGFGAGGMVIAVTVGTSQVGSYLAFIGLTILLGFLYLSLSICFSAICKKRVTSLGAGIMIFFWGMIMGTILFGIYLSTGGNWNDLITGNVCLPNWLWASIFLSPMDMSQTSVMLVFDIKEAFGFSIIPPDFINLGSLILVQLLWTIIPVILAYYFFERRDI